MTAVLLVCELAHRDKMGIVKTIAAGEVQRMSAGRGVFQTEFDHSREQTAQLLQTWIQPNVSGIDPSYAQNWLSEREKRGGLGLVIVSPEAADRSVKDPR